MFKAFSDNVIFLDTEFSSLDPYKGEILSVGIVKPTGEELYYELEFDGEADEWPQQHVLPYLKDKKYSREFVLGKVEEFLEGKNPFVVSYVNQFDSVYIYKMIGGVAKEDRPFFWIPIDFASILFGLGLDPEHLHYESGIFYDILGIDMSKYKKHNALDDARLLKDVYMKLQDSDNLEKLKVAFKN